MKPLSLKLKDDIYEETEKIVKKIHVPRNSYINSALFFYNKLYQRKLLKKQLAEESMAVRESSLEVLSEFEKIQDELAG